MNPKYTATLCLEIDATAQTPAVRRAFVTCSEGGSGALSHQMQYMSGRRVHVAVMGIVHQGETYQEAHDAALALTRNFPWIARFMDPDVASEIPRALARHDARRRT